MTVLRTELAIAEAIAHRELGDMERAVPELEVLADTRAETMLFGQILATLELAQSRLDAGEIDAARSAFVRAETRIAEESFGPGGRQWLARVGTRLAVAAGDFDEAQRWAGATNDLFWTGASQARVHLALGNRAAALAALDEAVPRCPRHEVVRDLLRARALSDHGEAQVEASAALELAARCEMLQTVASEGPDVLELAERAAWNAPAAWLDRLRRAVVSGASLPPAHGGDLVEHLTDRERDVLRYLPSRLTLSEIADELYVSVNTLKFHLKVIYRKLGVASRAEAAEKARHLPR
jgi:LuxR family maltose regulon positive regulatory protein